jgi:hypothetical protein
MPGILLYCFLLTWQDHEQTYPLLANLYASNCKQ